MAEQLHRARALLAEASGLDISAIPEDASIDGFEAWDSLVHMRLILAVEAQTGQELPPEAILEIANLHDLAKYLPD